MTKVNKINHIAVVVKNNTEALAFWRDILGLELDYMEEVPSMNLELAWLPVGETRVELIAPTTHDDNEYYEFIQEHGEGLHHICVEVDDIEETLSEMRSHGVKLKDTIAQQLPGRKIAFIKPESCNGVIVELYELTD